MKNKPYYEAREPLCDDPLLPRQVAGLIIIGASLCGGVILMLVMIIKALST